MNTYLGRAGLTAILSGAFLLASAPAGATLGSGPKFTDEQRCGFAMFKAVHKMNKCVVKLAVIDRLGGPCATQELVFQGCAATTVDDLQNIQQNKSFNGNCATKNYTQDDYSTLLANVLAKTLAKVQEIVGPGDVCTPGPD